MSQTKPEGVLTSQKVKQDPSEVCFLLPNFYLYKRKFSRALNLVRNYSLFSLMFMLALLLYTFSNGYLEGHFNHLKDVSNLSIAILFVVKLFLSCGFAIVFGMLFFILFENITNAFSHRPQQLLVFAPFYEKKMTLIDYLKVIAIIFGSSVLLYFLCSVSQADIYVPLILVGTSLLALVRSKAGRVFLYWLGTLNMCMVLKLSFFYMLETGA